MDETIAGASQKAALRRGALARRDALNETMRAVVALKLAEIGAAFLKPLAPRIVAGYWPIRSEADPRPLLAAMRAVEAGIALPVTGGDRMLGFRLWAYGAPLARAAHGIFEPLADAPEVVPDIVLVPLAAFDRRGHRLGYGKGYYDRTIGTRFTSTTRPSLIGMAFCVQEVDRIPEEPHDIALDAVITETAALDFRPAKT